MLRLFLLGFIAIVGLIATILSIVLFLSVLKWLKRLFSSSKIFINQQYQNWRIRQAEKNTPAFLREASERLTRIDLLTEQLTSKWKYLTDPLIKAAQEMLQMGMDRPEQAQLTRGYFTITLKAKERFIEALVDMNAVKQDTDVMHDEEEKKAKATIDVLMNDTYKYRARLESKKRFDFHVMMEVIKQRFGR